MIMINCLPPIHQRSFPWITFVVLVVLYFLGNLAGVPLLVETGAAIEPPGFWALAMLLAAVVIGISLSLARRTGLGAPLWEGRLAKADFPRWLGSGAALSVLAIAAGLPFSLLLNLQVDAASYPAPWQLILASVKAGIVEEIGYRFFVMSVLVWLGGLLWRDPTGRPATGVYWAALLVAGVLFGWAHVDARLSVPAAPFWALAAIMLLSSALGIFFGWLLWKLGLEWAMLAHFAYDAVVSAVLLPVYLAEMLWLWVVFLGFVTLAVVAALRWLTRRSGAMAG